MIRNVMGSGAHSWKEGLGWFQLLELMLQACALGQNKFELQLVWNLFAMDPVTHCLDQTGLPLHWNDAKVDEFTKTGDPGAGAPRMWKAVLPESLVPPGTRYKRCVMDCSQRIALLFNRVLQRLMLDFNVKF